MAAYDWPDTRIFVPQTSELRVIDNTQRSLESPLSGYVQTSSMPGARWGWSMDFGAQETDDRAQLEAYLLRLSGRQHRARLYDIKRPRPAGNIVPSGVTLAASAAQFASSLQLAGCRGSNAVLGGSFEVDSNADGLADGWLRFTGGSVGSLGASLSTTAVAHGTYSQSLIASALGATSSDRNGIQQNGVPVAHLAGQTITLAASMAATASTQLLLYVNWQNAGGSTIGGADLFASAAATGGVQALSVTGACPAAAVSANVYVYQHSGSGGAVTLLVDAVRLVAGSSSASYPGPATLDAGDWLGLATGQLVRVVADATATDAGAMTVEVRHILRTAASSGSAVVLDKPTALYVRTEAGLSLPRQPGRVQPPLSVEFVEAFA